MVREIPIADTEPRVQQLCYGSHGKPCGIARSGWRGALCFSGQRSLIRITRKRMSSVLALLLLISLLCLVLGLLSPKLFASWFKRVPTRRTILAWFGGAVFVLLVGFGFTAPPPEQGNTIAQSTKQEAFESETAVAPQEQEQADDIPGTEDEDIAVTAEGIVTDSEVEHLAGSGKAQSSDEPTPEPADMQQLYYIASVVDGDTVKVDVDSSVVTVRLIGIDTPETVHPSQPVECFGQEASQRTKALLEGKQVRLETDESQGDQDRYGRLLRYVFLPDGTSINKLLISEGYAYEYTYSTPYSYQTEFKQAQAEAQNKKRGLWADGVCEEASNTADTTSQDPVVDRQQGQEELTPVDPQVTGYTFYTSSHYSAEYYYCETDPGWQSLSPKYLKVYDSEAALLAAYPDHVLHQPCE